MASSQYSPQNSPRKPAPDSSETAPIPGYTDDEARDIYARAADIQSQTAFEDDRLTPEMLRRSANRAGISDAALQQAIKEREAERAANLEAEKIRAAQKAQLGRKISVGGIAVTMILVGSTLISKSQLSAGVAKVEAANAQVDNVLQRRHDLVPNLISVAKSTLENERALIEKLGAANAATQKAAPGAAKSAAESQLGNAISETLSALKSGEGGSSPVVLRLSDEMAGSENRIAVERRKYNLAVADYNRIAGGFPANLTRGLLGYRARYDFLPISDAARELPKF